MSSPPTIVLKHETTRYSEIKHTNVVENDEKTREKEKLSRIRSEDSMDNFDVSESNILSSLFDGIPIDINTKQGNHNKSKATTRTMKCVNVIQRAKQLKNTIMATGLRQPDEMRIIFTKRPLGIQIKPVNIHGFGAKISKITNHTVCDQGIEENMIIIGLNNKDLLGCTFDQIMTIIQSADLPITLRLKKISNNLLPQVNPIKISNTSYSSSHSLTSPSTLINLHLGPQRDHTSNNSMMSCMYDVNNIDPPSLTPKDNLMLAAFSVENMPTSTILSSSSDEDDIAHGSLVNNVINEDDDMESDIELAEEQEDEYGMSYVQWNNIRLGASVIKHGWVLDLDDDEDETTFELAYDTLTRQGLNIYEIRAAMRLIREQPEQIPPLETFKQLTIHNKRGINSSINPKFMPQQWLKEKNLTIIHKDADELLSSSDEDADDEEEYDEEEGANEDQDKEGSAYSSSTSSTLLSSGPSTTSLQNELKRMEQNSNNIYFDTFMNLELETQSTLNISNMDSNDDCTQNTAFPKLIPKKQKLYMSSSYNVPSHIQMLAAIGAEQQLQQVSRSYSENDHTYDRNLKRERVPYIKQPIAGYIDFFDDNESSMESESSSQSIELQAAMDVIGLKSPAPDILDIVELYSSSDEDKKVGLDFSDAKLVVVDATATATAIVDNDIYDNYSSSRSSSSANYMESDEKVIDGIGVSSYICTEGADDMLVDECLPQVMLKYVEKEEDDEKERENVEDKDGFKLMHHLNRNHTLMGLKNSIRGLSIKTNVKSIFKKITPRNTPLSVHVQND